MSFCRDMQSYWISPGRSREDGETNIAFALNDGLPFSTSIEDAKAFGLTMYREALRSEFMHHLQGFLAEMQFDEEKIALILKGFGKYISSQLDEDDAETEPNTAHFPMDEAKTPYLERVLRAAQRVAGLHEDEEIAEMDAALSELNRVIKDLPQ